MLMFLLIFEMIIICIIVLCHIMIEQKFNEIEKSTQIYTNKRAYRTKQSVAFIEDVIKRYQKYVSKKNQEPDLYSMIKSSLLKEYIGKFTFIGVSNVANKGKYIMWGIIILEVFIGFINNEVTSVQGIIVIISSLLLTIGIEIFIIIKAVEEKKEAIIILVEDYVLNMFPLQINTQIEIRNNTENGTLEDRQISEMISLKKSEEKDFSTVLVKGQNKKSQEKEINTIKRNIKKTLTEQDIAKFINNLSDL